MSDAHCAVARTAVAAVPAPLSKINYFQPCSTKVSESIFSSISQKEAAMSKRGRKRKDRRKGKANHGRRPNA